MNTVGLVVVVLVLVLPILAKIPAVRRLTVALLTRLGRRLLELMERPIEYDEVADDLAKAFRREQLRGHIHRLERILATDEHMSATRQLGNRLAYDWLIRELDRSRSTLAPGFIGDDFLDTWNTAGAPPLTRTAAPTSYAPRTPQVETLELGRRR